MHRLFISHSWKYSDAYDKIIGMLATGEIKYYNHSVPKDDPIHTNGTDKQLYNAIDSKIRGCSCVIILAGVYSSYSRWINIEIDIAKKYGKPIIAVEPWGSEKTSKVVKDNATKIVGWNYSSICNSIIELA
ncbi:hypothetical protein D3C80_994350 [compost metagenome]